MPDELAHALTAQDAAETLLREWETEALHALAGLVPTPLEGYGHPGTGPGQFKADARRLRELVAGKDRLLAAAAFRVAQQVECLAVAAEHCRGFEEYKREALDRREQVQILYDERDGWKEKLDVLREEVARLRAFAERPVYSPEGEPIVPGEVVG